MSSLAKQLEETIGNAENFSPDKMEVLVGETMKILHALQSKIESADPKDREEALQIALELKEAIQKKAEELCKEIGMNPEELTQFVQNPSNFSSEEHRALQHMSENLGQFKQEKRSEKKKKQPPLWIHG